MPETRPRLSIIAAVARNRVIGAQGKLPWRLPEDLRRFKSLTLGHPVIMGRKTYESIVSALGGPLPGRFNIVVSRSAAFSAPRCGVADSIDNAISLATRQPGGEDAFVIGGAEIYRLTLPLATRMHLTEIDAEIEGDTYFPAFSRNHWTETLTEPGGAQGDLRYRFVSYERR